MYHFTAARYFFLLGVSCERVGKNPRHVSSLQRPHGDTPPFFKSCIRLWRNTTSCYRLKLKQEARIKLNHRKHCLVIPELNEIRTWIEWNLSFSVYTNMTARERADYHNLKNSIYRYSPNLSKIRLPATLRIPMWPYIISCHFYVTM